MAIALQRFVLRLAPGHPRAASDVAIAESAIASRELAEQLFEVAIGLEPEITCHHRCYASLRRFVGIERVEGFVRAALALDPSFAPAHAALGNILMRRGLQDDAMSAYGLATMLDWDFADAHLALAEFFETKRDEANAARHRAEAVRRKVLYVTHAPYAIRRVLVLNAPGGVISNASLDFCVDRNRTDLSVLYVTDRVTELPKLPDHALIFNAIAESERHESTVERCIALLAHEERPVLNHPIHLTKVRRSNLYATLDGVAGCIVPKTVRVARDAVSGEAAYPFLIRPIDTHRGDGLVLVRAPGELDEYLARFPDAHFNVSPFVDFRSADGYYRKYRVAVVAGEPFPYHLAISQDWLIHYVRAADSMREHAWMRDEEERFLRDPSSVFPTWTATFGEMAERIGLEYFGVDCAAMPDGRVLVFECDPAAFIHCGEAIDGPFSYKYDYVPRIFEALEGLFSHMTEA